MAGEFGGTGFVGTDETEVGSPENTDGILFREFAGTLTTLSLQVAHAKRHRKDWKVAYIG